MPVRGVAPVGPVDQRIQAQAVNRHTGSACAAHFVRHLIQPRRAAIAEVAGLGDDQRALVALPRRSEQRCQGGATRVAQVPPEALVAGHLPLAVVIVVHANQVERAGIAAELRFGPPGQHVPGLPLVAADLGGGGGKVGPVDEGDGRHHMHQRLDMQEARARINAAHRLDRAQRSVHKAALHGVAERMAVAPRVNDVAFGQRAPIGMEQVALRHRPGHETDFVDRVVDRRRGAEGRQRLRHGARKGFEARAQRATGRAGVVVHQAHIGRRAVVHQRPDHLQAVVLRAARDAHGAAQVIATRRRLGKSPADAFTHRANAERGSALVVGFERIDVAAQRRHVERTARTVDVVGTLVAAHPERRVRRARDAACGTLYRVAARATDHGRPPALATAARGVTGGGDAVSAGGTGDVGEVGGEGGGGGGRVVGGRSARSVMPRPCNRRTHLGGFCHTDPCASARWLLTVVPRRRRGRGHANFRF